MYVTQSPNDVIALDAKSGHVFWVYHYNVSPAARPCCGVVNRGVAILGDTLFMATVDAHLVAIDARKGHAVWNVKVADAAAGYAMTLAPLIVKDKVIVGVAGGEYGIRGFVSAYDARTGEQAVALLHHSRSGRAGPRNVARRFLEDTAARPTWVTGSYDPDLNLIYWGTGNPGPDFNGEQAPRRQSLLRFRACARRRIPASSSGISSSRRTTLRLRLGASSGAGRCGLEQGRRAN